MSVWYHGSRWLFSKIETRQPVNPNGKPKEGSLEAVYLTSDFGTALAFAARPEGVSKIDHERRTIRFENPDLFDSEREVYIYFVDLSQIPEERIIRVSPWQVVVLEEIEPVKVERHKAGEVRKYFNIVEGC